MCCSVGEKSTLSNWVKYLLGSVAKVSDPRMDERATRMREGTRLLEREEEEVWYCCDFMDQEHRESKCPKRHFGWWRRHGLTIFKK